MAAIRSNADLCSWIAPSLPKERKISVERKVLATLWYLGSTETFRIIGDRFNMSKGSMHRVLHTVCSALVGQQQQCIKWPDVTQMECSAQEFQEKCGFPDVIGVIDATDIHIPDPNEKRCSYVNGTGNTSIQLQVVCNQRLLFLDVYTGWPGSVHDAQVFCSSTLGRKLDRNGLPRRFHLLGDSAYPLTNYLMVPFRDNGHLSTVQRKFNEALLSTHVEVERAIGLLKGKFHRLRYLEMLAVDMMPVIILAACVLHNFIITSSGIDEGDIEQVQRRQQEDYQEQPAISAQAKRMTIAYQLA
ncbi:putative nuclease HARBI1 isoform X2 [Pomacea canaliculata]|uniref:putative nuclease HARBI1 isoform X2 n=1 Tax=Pomacea canaliculata TaxID=400727 RepID=UPI000D72A43B|nr:putative nuclease HARBI1 isoform X2 [Pomacea canaliculata]